MKRRGMRLARFALGGLAVAVGFSAGCESMGGGGSVVPSNATTVGDEDVRDIPKPKGFTRVDKPSVFWRSGQYRIGELWYSGKSSPAAVKRFYEQYMPTAGFELREMSLRNGQYNARFETEREVCTVRIVPESFGTSLVIELVPRGHGPVNTGLSAPPMAGGRAAVPQPRVRPELLENN